MPRPLSCERRGQALKLPMSGRFFFRSVLAFFAALSSAARAAKLARFPSPFSDHRRSGPERDFGPSL
ncbi:MAG TPA: hypothetical protein PKE40_15685 [Arachnia sp.]|nr:hypothetical protein [Arachnia sp.]HMT87782.1 hypothetical protein [Arachnia sp.]